MSTGALIFAFNNSDIDYLSMAKWNAKNIRRHLNIGTTVVTDSEQAVSDTDFENVILTSPGNAGTRHFADIGHNVAWHNGGRVDAYNLTPYDQTLVLDADYVVASSQLQIVLAANKEFMCHRYACNLVNGEYIDGLNVFGKYNMPMWWATVMMFRKSNITQYIFDCMQMVRDNWQHYKDLYGISRSTYRNDFALSIALGIVTGHTLRVHEIPWPLMSLMPEVAVKKTELDGYALGYSDSLGKSKQLSISGLDFHAMGKKHLGDIIASDC